MYGRNDCRQYGFLHVIENPGKLTGSERPAFSGIDFIVGEGLSIVNIISGREGQTKTPQNRAVFS